MALVGVVYIVELHQECSDRAFRPIFSLILSKSLFNSAKNPKTLQTVRRGKFGTRR